MGRLPELPPMTGRCNRRLDSIATHGEHIVARLDTGDGTVGKLLADEDIYIRIDTVLSEVERLIADIQENPTRYFKFSVF